MSIKDPNSRLVCPSLLLQQYDFAILEHCMHDASVNLQFSTVGQKLLVNMPILGTQKTQLDPNSVDISIVKLSKLTERNNVFA